MVTELRNPGVDATEFTIQGRTFRATESLSVARYKVFQKRNVEFGFNGTFKTIAQAHDEIWAHLEKGQMGSAAQKLGNLRDGISYAGSGRIGGVELAALFFNEEGEDLGYNHSAMRAKQELFESSDLDVSFFFQQAALRVSGFYERFTRSSPPEAPPAPTPEP